MRILYHHRTASKDGQAVHIEEMVHALREQGHEVVVVAPSVGEGDMGAEVGWVRVMRSHLPKAIYECLELGYSLLAYWRLLRAARAFRPHVIYERYNLFMLAGVLLKWRLRLPLLLEVNAPLVDERMRFGGLGLPWMGRWAEGLAWRSADVVLPVTQVLAGHVRARGVPADRIQVIPNGINDASFAAAPGTAAAKAALDWQDALVLGFTGFVRDWHGVDRVLRWMSSPSAPANARLLIVGDGPARGDLESLAVELKLVDRVRFTGVVARDRVASLVAAFDVALQPAVVPYASPLKLFEYLALGKAIIAPRTPNIEEVLVDGQNGLLFDDTGARDFEATLTLLCADVGLRQRLGMAAADSIPRLGLTWQRNAQRVALLADGLRAASCGSASTDVRAS